MKTSPYHLTLLALIGACFGLSTTHAADYVFDAYIPKIDAQYLHLADGSKFPMVAETSPYGQRLKYRFRTGCYEMHGHKITCETLFAVGYVDRARITVKNNAVKSVRVLELQQ